MTASTDIDPPRVRATVANWLLERVRALLAGCRSHAALYTVAFAAYAAGVIQSIMLGRPVSLGLASLASTSVLVVVMGVIGVRLMSKLVSLWRSGYPGSPTLALLRELFNNILTPGRISNGFHVTLVTGIFAIGFTNMKANIPKAVPFSWDETLMYLDKAMHFGVLPHELLMPLFGFPTATMAMNVLYNCWFVMQTGFVIWQGFRDRDTALRQRFLMSYLLTWIVGTCIVGLIFSSAGPCFYGRVAAGPDPYAALMAYLHHAADIYPIWAISTQDTLWENYVTSDGVIAGISAMPSMHVGTSVLFFICAWASGKRWLTWLSGIFAVVILFGSVLLAWHYAVDGYAGALVAAFCWWLAGLWVKRNPVSSRPS